MKETPLSAPKLWKIIIEISEETTWTKVLWVQMTPLL